MGTGFPLAYSASSDARHWGSSFTTNYQDVVFSNTDSSARRSFGRNLRRKSVICEVQRSQSWTKSSLGKLHVLATPAHHQPSARQQWPILDTAGTAMQLVVLLSAHYLLLTKLSRRVSFQGDTAFKNLWRILQLLSRSNKKSCMELTATFGAAGASPKRFLR